MLVYGDSVVPRTIGECLVEIEQMLLRAQAKTGVPRFDRIRAALIAAGKLEQGIADLPLREALPLAEALTDSLADLLLRQVDKSFHPAASGDWECRLEAVQSWSSTLIQTKSPEGFAFYSLYPQQYARAALTQLKPNSKGQVLVVGIRSIGTTLSAVVASALRSRGDQVRRVTVRPTGHPFARSVNLEIVPPRPEDIAIVVDEGPGLSGSSMASVVKALHEVGYQPSQIVLMPGHEAEPGPAASFEVREIWASHRRLPAGREQVSWRGRTLDKVLEEATEELLGSSVAAFNVLSNGNWREFRKLEPSKWPAAYPQWESAKFLVECENGEAILWKFSGLGTEGMHAFDRLLRRSGEGLCPEPLDIKLGYIGTRWIPGAPITLSRPDRPSLKQIVRHIHLCRTAPLGPEASPAFHRLMELVDVNLGESLGLVAARSAVHLGLMVEAKAAGLPGYGDGRMGPEEWIALPDDQYLKTDAAGHFEDHTFVGRQTVVWDLAGAFVEWELDSTGSAELLQQYSRVSGNLVEYDLLRFYGLAYCALRLGMASMSLESSPDPASHASLSRAYDRYRRWAAAACEVTGGAYVA